MEQFLSLLCELFEIPFHITLMTYKASSIMKLNIFLAKIIFSFYLL